MLAFGKEGAGAPPAPSPRKKEQTPLIKSRAEKPLKPDSEPNWFKQKCCSNAPQAVT
jgi:hypothetical protein